MTQTDLDQEKSLNGTRWAPLAVVGTAQLMVMLDSTVVNVALPSIGKDLSSTAAALQWVLSGYVLMYGSLLLFGGRLADVLGRRRAFLAGLILFAITSMWCAAATTPHLLIAGRVAQGAAAAVLSSAALSIVVTIYVEPSQRRIALTIWSGLGVLGATIGVVLGGLIVTALDWRWVFLINILIAAGAFVGALRNVAPLRSEVHRPLHFWTALLVSAGLAALTQALIQAQNGVSQIGFWGALVAAAILITAAVVVDLKREDPLLPLHLLRIPTYLASSVGLMLSSAVMISSSYLGSMYFQRSHNMSALLAGLSLLPVGLASLAVAAVLPKLIARHGPGRVYLAGALAQLVGSAALAVGSTNVPVTILLLAVIGFGLPSAFVPLYGIGASHLALKDAGIGSGLLNTFNQTGGALGIAVAGTVLTAALRDHLSTGASAAAAIGTGVSAGFSALAVCAALSLVVALILNRLAKAA